MTHRELLDQHRRRLAELEMEATVMYPVGHERHERAVAAWEDLQGVVTRLEAAIRNAPADKRPFTKIKVDPWQ